MKVRGTNFPSVRGRGISGLFLGLLVALAATTITTTYVLADEGVVRGPTERQGKSMDVAGAQTGGGTPEIEGKVAPSTEPWDDARTVNSGSEGEGGFLSRVGLRANKEEEVENARESDSTGEQMEEDGSSPSTPALEEQSTGESGESDAKTRQARAAEIDAGSGDADQQSISPFEGKEEKGQLPSPSGEGEEEQEHRSSSESSPPAAMTSSAAKTPASVSVDVLSAPDSLESDGVAKEKELTAAVGEIDGNQEQQPTEVRGESVEAAEPETEAEGAPSSEPSGGAPPQNDTSEVEGRSPSPAGLGTESEAKSQNGHDRSQTEEAQPSIVTTPAGGLHFSNGEPEGTEARHPQGSAVAVDAGPRGVDQRSVPSLEGKKEQGQLSFAADGEEEKGYTASSEPLPAAALATSTPKTPASAGVDGMADSPVPAEKAEDDGLPASTVEQSEKDQEHSPSSKPSTVTASARATTPAQEEVDGVRVMSKVLRIPDGEQAYAEQLSSSHPDSSTTTNASTVPASGAEGAVRAMEAAADSAADEHERLQAASASPLPKDEGSDSEFVHGTSEEQQPAGWHKEPEADLSAGVGVVSGVSGQLGANEVQGDSGLRQSQQDSASQDDLATHKEEAGEKNLTDSPEGDFSQGVGSAGSAADGHQEQEHTPIQSEEPGGSGFLRANAQDQEPDTSKPESQPGGDTSSSSTTTTTTTTSDSTMDKKFWCTVIGLLTVAPFLVVA
ncbi:hypothetical protein CSUI_010001 [Cystoisospora suis]|uniref:Uncharacterized protein n=1 Tax=Cystoisospora suis TaxID=483139 RepID=A0A2C6KI61_9APIC|nr:hypothetical protein CSUI_010001 [Cystoisospora suis]